MRVGSAVAMAALLLGCSSSDGEDPQPDDDTGAGTSEPTSGSDEDADPTEDIEDQRPDPEPVAMQVVVLTGPEGGTSPAVSVEIPQSWTVLDLGPAEQPSGSAADQADLGIAPQQWCLVPAEDIPGLAGCAGIYLAVGGDWLPGEDGAPYAANQAAGWRPTTEPLLCPFDEEAELVADEDGILQGNVVEPVAGESAPLTSNESYIGEVLMRYETWRVSCTQTGEHFTPQVWQSRANATLIRDYLGLPEAITVVTTFEPVQVDDETATGNVGDTGGGPTEAPGDTASQTDAPETTEAPETDVPETTEDSD